MSAHVNPRFQIGKRYLPLRELLSLALAIHVQRRQVGGGNAVDMERDRSPELLRVF
jgi:hypothetical protein